MYAPRGQTDDLRVGLDAEHPQACAPEVAHVLVGMKPEKVRAQETAQYRLAHRHRPVGLVRRKGNMKEKTDRQMDTEFAQHVGHETKLVVVHPDHVVRSGELGDGFCVHLVDALVGPVTLLREPGPFGETMQEGPQHSIAEALVETFDIASAQKNRHATVAPELARDDGALIFGDIHARPAEPGERPPLRDRTKRRGQAARARTRLPALLSPRQRHGQPDGRDDELTAPPVPVSFPAVALAHSRTTTVVPVPKSSPTFTPCQPSGTAGLVHKKTRRASMGERFTQPWLRGIPNTSCQ